MLETKPEPNNSITKELIFARKRFKAIFEGNAAGMTVVDQNRNIILINQRLCDMAGYTKEECIGKNVIFAHMSPESAAQFKKYFLKVKEEEGFAKVEYFMLRKSSGGLWVEMFGSPIELDENHFGVIWSIIDISERKAAEETIKKLAFYDALTGLANRRLLEDRFELMIQNKIRVDHYGAIIFLDLDNFKSLNDSLGHHAGDIFFKEVATRLLDCVRKVDSVVRLGGDEFVIVIDKLHSEKEESKNRAYRVANKILESLRAPYDIDIIEENKPSRSVKHTSSASIGVTLFNQKDTNLVPLLRRADNAMYDAKKSGKNSIQFCDEYS